MIITFEPEITKEYILSKLSQEEIIEYYLQEPINYSKFYLSPLREEKHPSFTFLNKRNGVYWRDWGTSESGDCFDLVQKMYNIGFNDSLKKIYSDILKQNKSVLKQIKKTKKSQEKIKYDIVLYEQPFTLNDIRYWKQYNIDLEILNLYNVKSIQKVVKKTNDVCFEFYYTYSNPIYCYNYDKNVYKIYKPFTQNKLDKFYFKGTVNTIEGYDQLDWLGDLLIITKSLKDVMCLRSFGYNAISLQGEANLLSPELYKTLSKRFKKIISLYDYDKTGIEGSSILQTSYNIDPIYINEEYQCKDISDFCSKFGVECTKNFLTQITNKYDITQNRDT